jgi:PIN domain
MNPVANIELPPPVNHVFVDYENVQEIDLAVIGTKAVSFTLLLGPRQTKLDVPLVEKLLAHAASVQLLRLTSPGKNALDFTLAYYLGRAVLADPTGFFHIVSKDAGFDPLVEHLRSKHVRARRHDSFATLTFAGLTKPPAPAPSVAAPKPRSPAKPKVPLSVLDERETEVLEHLRKPATTRPRNQKKLLSFLVAYFGRRITEAETLDLIEHLSQAGHLVIGEKGAVTYHLEPK